ncbi:hypothetical protein Cs7R123_61760 [Catellatospora sp. TT07R-123]|nr:hypothetical protein Cs7R123_61760 [Catellatospora sp. TT07R-123]
MPGNWCSDWKSIGLIDIQACLTVLSASNNYWAKVRNFDSTNKTVNVVITKIQNGTHITCKTVNNVVVHPNDTWADSCSGSLNNNWTYAALASVQIGFGGGSAQSPSVTVVF